MTVESRRLSRDCWLYTWRCGLKCADSYLGKTYNNVCNSYRMRQTVTRLYADLKSFILDMTFVTVLTPVINCGFVAVGSFQTLSFRGWWRMSYVMTHGCWLDIIGTCLKTMASFRWIEIVACSSSTRDYPRETWSCLLSTVVPRLTNREIKPVNSWIVLHEF